MKGEGIASVLAAVGFVWLLKSAVVLLNWVWKTFLRPGRDLKEYYGSWALITGPTDGIGKALAFSLAKRGLNLVLVGRNPEKLAAVSREIREKCHCQGCGSCYEKIEVKCVVVDFCGDNIDEGMEAIEAEIRGLDLGVVVNNVGVFYHPYPMFFHEVGQELLQELVKVNVEAATRVTRMVLPHMMRKRKEKKGAIVNIGSAVGMGFWKNPLITVYSATKRYLEQFSRSLHVEYRKHGIDIQCQTPYLIATKMTKMERSFCLVASPEEYAESSIRWIGYEGSCCPFWAHSVLCWTASLLPHRLVDSILFHLALLYRAKKEQALLADECSCSRT